VSTEVVIASEVMGVVVMWFVNLENALESLMDQHFVMIIRFLYVQNPAELTGPKGFVPISQSPIFDVGKVEPAGL
jgi:hypothetical protein